MKAHEEEAARAAALRREASSRLSVCTASGDLLDILKQLRGYVAVEDCRAAWIRVVEHSEVEPSHDVVTMRGRPAFTADSANNHGRWSEKGRDALWATAMNADHPRDSLRALDSSGSMYRVTHNEGWLTFRRLTSSGSVENQFQLVIVSRHASIRTEKLWRRPGTRNTGKVVRVIDGLVAEEISGPSNHEYAGAIDAILRAGRREP